MSSADHPAIRCTDLSKHFGDLSVIDGFNLEVHQGEFIALLGASGCGKTTLLRLIAGFDNPDNGVIEIADRTVAGSGRPTPPERRRVGMVFQEYALFPHLDVGGNIRYGLNGNRNRAARADEVMSLVGLSGLEKRMPHELSGGQQQRVALARALAPRPDVILLDEPFSNLDAGLRVRLRMEVRDILRQAGATTVFVTHDQDEALSLADRVAVMQGGKIVQMGPPDVLYRMPSTRDIAAFVGEANFVAGEAAGDTVTCGLGNLPLPLCRPARGKVEVMVRPEWIEIESDPAGEAEVTERVFFGHDQMVRLRLANGLALQVRLGPYQMVQPGDRVNVQVRVPVVAYPSPNGAKRHS